MSDKEKYSYLTPINKRTPEEQRAISIKGGKASAIAHREKKSLRYLFKLGMKHYTKLRMQELADEGKDPEKEILNDIGFVAHSVFKIASGDNVDPKTKLSALNTIMDRVEGKAIQKTSSDVTLNDKTELSDEEKEIINRRIKAKADKIIKQKELETKK